MTETVTLDVDQALNVKCQGEAGKRGRHRFISWDFFFFFFKSSKRFS